MMMPRPERDSQSGSAGTFRLNEANPPAALRGVPLMQWSRAAGALGMRGSAAGIPADGAGAAEEGETVVSAGAGLCPFGKLRAGAGFDRQGGCLHMSIFSPLYNRVFDHPVLSFIGGV